MTIFPKSRLFPQPVRSVRIDESPIRQFDSDFTIRAAAAGARFPMWNAPPGGSRAFLGGNFEKPDHLAALFYGTGKSRAAGEGSQPWPLRDVPDGRGRRVAPHVQGTLPPRRQRQSRGIDAAWWIGTSLRVHPRQPSVRLYPADSTRDGRH